MVYSGAWPKVANGFIKNGKTKNESRKRGTRTVPWFSCVVDFAFVVRYFRNGSVPAQQFAKRWPGRTGKNASEVKSNYHSHRSNDFQFTGRIGHTLGTIALTCVIFANTPLCLWICCTIAVTRSLWTHILAIFQSYPRVPKDQIGLLMLYEIREICLYCKFVKIDRARGFGSANLRASIFKCWTTL